MSGTRIAGADTGYGDDRLVPDREQEYEGRATDRLAVDIGDVGLLLTVLSSWYFRRPRAAGGPLCCSAPGLPRTSLT